MVHCAAYSGSFDRHELLRLLRFLANTNIGWTYSLKTRSQALGCRLNYTAEEIQGCFAQAQLNKTSGMGLRD
jgi:hypothetical protein